MSAPAWPDIPASQLKADPERLALLGHDLRAAVSDVLGGIRLIDQDRLDDPTRLQIERVRAAGEVLARLLEESLSTLLGEDGIEGQHVSNVQVSRFLYDIEVRWSGRAREKGIGFHVSVEPDVPAVLALDRIALERVVANILSNAVKYTDRGAVRLCVGLSDERSLRLSVRDEGPGFSPEALQRLFEYEGRPDGTPKPGHGLGLHISHDMATRLGGRVTVENLPEGGAEVALILPAASWTPATPEERADLPDLSRVKILLAEDNATNQMIIGHMLAAMGAEYAVASDGVEALHWLEREDFDLALIDIEMPRLSGIEVIRGLRSMGCARARMPVLAVTAYVLRANRDAIYAAGADGILAKPLPGLDTFGQAIAAALGRAQSGLPAPPDAARDAPELNRARFDHLLSIAGPEAARELLDRLEADLRRAERGLVAGLSEPDRAAIRSETHVLIALAGAVGAERLQALAEALNAAAHRREDALMRTLGTETLGLLDRLIHAVTHESGQRGAFE